MKPTARDLLLLLALQVGISALCAGVLAILPFNTGSGSWVGGIGVMIGAQSFVFFKAKKEPQAFSGGYAHWLALWAALGQIALAALLAGAFLLAEPGAVDGLGLSLPMMALLVIGIAGPLAYGLTRWGIRMGLSGLARARSAGAKATIPAKR